MMNQAIFSKLLVESDGRITAEFTKPFKSIVTPITDVLAHYKQEKARGTEITTDFLSVIANRISHFFGHGLNNDFLVERPQPTVNTPHDLKPLPQSVPLSRPAEYRQW